jgi:hypothetical protein
MALDSSAALHPLHFQRPAANLGRRWLQLRDFSEQFPAAACEHWLAQQLNRAPVAAEFYLAGRELYNAGMYLGASKLLKLYVETPNALLPGHHLLGYAYFMNGNKALALKHLTLCANGTAVISP